MKKSSDPTFPDMDDGSLPDRKSEPAVYTHYFVCGLKTDYTGKHDPSEENVRFLSVDSPVWYPDPDRATRCTKITALEHLSARQTEVGSVREDDYFIARADVTLTRVKIDLVDYVKE